MSPKLLTWLRNKKDATIATVLLIISSVTHLIFFGQPAAVVFDETYFLRFVGYYEKGLYFFDVHPPLGKLIFFLYGKLLGITASIDIGTIGEALDPTLLYYRVIPLVAGILLPIVVYYLCRQINLSKISALTVGILLCIENSLIVQSRIVVMDILLVLFGFISLLLYTLYYNHPRHHKNKLFILIGSAIFFAAAGSIKWSGIFFFFPILVFELHRLWTSRDLLTKKLLKFTNSMLVYVITFIIIYLGIFAIHFSLLPHQGPGDAFMSTGFNATHDELTEPVKEGTVARKFFGKFFELNATMFDATNSLTEAHPYSSKYYTWPFMRRPIYYWQDITTKSDPSIANARIYLLGNPIIYWLSTLSMIFMMIYGLSNFGKKHNKNIKDDKTLLFILTAFMGNFLPFILIGRVMFLYHYAAALVVTIMSLGYCLDLIKKRRSKIIVSLLILLVCLSTFIFFSPITYGIPLQEKHFKARMWLSTWE
jgi:dolichyl-phosphate-mannose-protein mannosyltransferase